MFSKPFKFHFSKLFKRMQTIFQKSLACFFSFICLTATMAQTPVLLKDINNSIVNGSPRGMTTVGNTVYFSATDGVHGRELWKTSGTEASTVLVKDINPNGDANPANFCNVNGTVFFTANDSQQSTQLWKTDGSAAGTQFVANILLGNASSSFTQLTACNGKLFFRGYQPTTPPAGPPVVELKLFVSDGTTLGTKVLGTTLSMPQNLTAVGTTLFLSGISPTNPTGNQLLKTDGATVLIVKDFQFANETANDKPSHFVNVNGALFFSAKNSAASGRQIWKSNGTGVGTVPMSNTANGFNVSEITHVNGTVFFAGIQNSPIVPSTGNQVFRINSANNLTQIGAVSAANLTSVENALVYTEISQLGAFLTRLPLNSVFTTSLKTFPTNGIPSNLTVAGTTLFFVASNGTAGRELWKFNAAGTNMIQDFVAGSTDAGIADMRAFGSDVMFASEGLGGNELRRATTSTISTIRNIGRAGSFPKEFVKMGAFTFFTADDGTSGRELWKTDGTAANTQRVADIIAGSEGSNPVNLLVVTATNGVQTLFFEAKSTAKGRELFKLENTLNAAPICISDIIAGAGNAGIGNMTNVNGTLHFTATTGIPNLGNRIYRVNAARTGVETTGGAMVFANDLRAMGSTLFFTQTPQIGGPLLCKIVAGATATIKTFALIPGGEYPVPQQLTVVGTRLFFTAADAQRGRELWVTNAAATLATPISDIIAGSTGSGIANLTNFNGILHFTAANPGVATGARIYKTNAALTGVETTGGLQSAAGNLTAAGTKLYFTQATQLGATLHKLENGLTSPALATFSIENMPLNLTAAGTKLFFTASSAAAGRELWKSDGTTIGTAMVSDIRAGVGNANILEINLSGQDLFLSANDLTFGQEPWILANASALGGSEMDDRSSETDENVIESVSVAPQIKVYPNPASNYVQVDVPAEMEGNLSLLSASGQMVRSVQSADGETSISMDIQDLPKGVYLVRWVQSDEQTVVKKLIVQ